MKIYVVNILAHIVLPIDCVHFLQIAHKDYLQNSMKNNHNSYMDF